MAQTKQKNFPYNILETSIIFIGRAQCGETRTLGSGRGNYETIWLSTFIKNTGLCEFV